MKGWVKHWEVNLVKIKSKRKLTVINVNESETSKCGNQKEGPLFWISEDEMVTENDGLIKRSIVDTCFCKIELIYKNEHFISNSKYLFQ